MNNLIKKLVNKDISFNIVNNEIIVSALDNWDNIEKRCFYIIKNKKQDNTWIRSMLLATRTAKKLKAEKGIIDDMYSRLKTVYQLENKITSLKSKVLKAFEKLNKKPKMPNGIIITLCKWNLRPGSIANYNHDTGVMAIDPKVKDNKYLEHIVIHELIHAYLGKTKDSHAKDFIKIAKDVDLPFKYRD